MKYPSEVAYLYLNIYLSRRIHTHTHTHTHTQSHTHNPSRHPGLAAHAPVGEEAPELRRGPRQQPPVPAERHIYIYIPSGLDIYIYIYIYIYISQVAPSSAVSSRPYLRRARLVGSPTGRNHALLAGSAYEPEMRPPGPARARGTASACACASVSRPRPRAALAFACAGASCASSCGRRGRTQPSLAAVAGSVGRLTVHRRLTTCTGV